MSIPLQRCLAAGRATLVPVVANTVVLLLAAFAGGQRHFIVNFDYFVVPLAYLAVRLLAGHVVATATAGLLLALLVAADAWGAINGHYFADPSMLFDLLPFVTVWPWRLLAPLLLAGAVLGMLLVAAAAPAKPRVAAIVPVVLLMLAALGADRAGSFVGAVPGAGGTLLSSGTANLLRPAINQFLNERGGTVRSPTPILANSFAVAYTSATEVPPRLLSVGIESWGVSRNRTTLDRQVALLSRGLGDQYEVAVGSHAFHGSTLEGEVRELCGLRLNGIPRNASERAPLGDCLPRALAARGYATSGWHGNSGSFYRRNDIYPAIGLEIVNSYETLRPRVSRLCQFLFVGICDADVLRMAVGSFAKDERAFVHVMTLDTHLPLPPPKGDCVDGKNSQLCSWEEGIDRTLESIVQALRSATVKPDLVVLFGDHAPPFLDLDTRSRFVTGQVPFVVLWRQGAQPRLQAVAASSPVELGVGTGRLVSQR